MAGRLSGSENGVSAKAGSGWFGRGRGGHRPARIRPGWSSLPGCPAMARQDVRQSGNANVLPGSRSLPHRQGLRPWRRRALPNSGAAAPGRSGTRAWRASGGRPPDGCGRARTWTDPLPRCLERPVPGGPPAAAAPHDGHHRVPSGREVGDPREPFSLAFPVCLPVYGHVHLEVEVRVAGRQTVVPPGPLDGAGFPVAPLPCPSGAAGPGPADSSSWSPGLPPSMKGGSFSFNGLMCGPLDDSPSPAMTAFMCGCSRGGSPTGRPAAFRPQPFLPGPSPFRIGSGAGGGTSPMSGWTTGGPRAWWYQVPVPSRCSFTQRLRQLTLWEEWYPVPSTETSGWPSNTVQPPAPFRAAAPRGCP